MKKVKLGQSDLAVGVMSYGCWRQCTITVAESRPVIEAALEAGMTLIDTADIYGWGSPAGFGGAESMLGQMIKESPHLRDAMVLATKGGITRNPPYDSSYNYLVSACEGSLKRLQVEQIDLYQIHRSDLLTPVTEVARALSHLVDSGKVGHIGVSNFSPSQYNALQSQLDFPIITHQPELSLVRSGPIEDGLLDQCQQLDIACLAWSSLAGGALATGVDANGMSAERFASLMDSLDQVAAKYDASRSQIALAFLLKLPAKVIPIIGTQQIDRVQEAAAACDIMLMADDWYILYAASRSRPMP